MPVIVKAKKNENAGSLIRKFKKIISNMEIVQNARDSRYFKKPSALKAERNAEKRHLRKKLKTLKKMKNVPARSLESLREKINSL
ncbi:MAG TPA: 30S ribosomal protein S21 [Candidatus Woesebacteria bacterium]|nr:30S ribosomal protein S21 [Candidatus Woesebacteria bacterium]